MQNTGILLQNFTSVCQKLVLRLVHKPYALIDPEPRSPATVAVLPGPLFIYLGESASFMQNTRILLQNFTSVCHKLVLRLVHKRIWSP